VPPGRGRDQRIDLLRGFAVLAMVVDHIAGPSLLYALTGGNRFYTSAAEGFIFISGLVMGLVYQRLIERDGLGPSLRRAIERAVTLYLVTITLTLLFIPISELLGLHWAQGIDFSDPLGFVVSVLTLHQTYYLVDIPLLYTILILISPLALVMLSQGRTAVVLGASWLLWLAYQFFPQQAEVPWPIAGNYLFFVSAWQVFFFTGLVLGWHHSDLTTRLARFPRRPALVVAGAGSAILIAGYWLSSRLDVYFPISTEHAQELQLFALDNLFAKADMRPGRIVASIVVFGFLYLLVTEAWRPLARATGWFMLPLGEHALYAYAAHVVLAIPIALALDAISLPDRYQRPLNLVLQIGALAVIWLLIRWRILFINPARGYARFAWPVGATVACLALLPLGTSMAVPGIAAPQFESDTFDTRVARAFGTPVPGRPARPNTERPLELPRAGLRPAPGPRTAAAPPPANVSPYVGPLRGSLYSYGFFSRALDTDKPYFVYLPPGYDTEARRYPVLYMLHGNSGSMEEWAAYGLIDRADRMITAREILPLIIILPQGDFSYWLNHVDNGPKYGDYIVADLVRHVNATYRVLPGRENRAIGGLSMGGTGALLHAMRFPNVFGVVGAHSPSLPAEGEREFLGEGRDFELRDPLSQVPLARRLHELFVWIDIGDEDDWVPRTRELHEALVDRGIDHEFHLWRGDHDGDYWATHVPEYLRYYDRALNPERRL
jgi:enterochelin esterase-like enzyme